MKKRKGKKMEENKQTNEQVSNKKGAKIVALIAIIAVIAVIIVGIIYYTVICAKPDRMYKKVVESKIDAYTKEVLDTDYKTSKTTLKLSANVNPTNDDILDEDVIKLINNTKIDFNVQTDNENKKIIVNLESDYENEDLLNMQVYSDVANKESYVYFKDFLNKYIEADLDDEIYTNYSELLDNQKISSDKKESFKKAMKILKKEVKDSIKSEYCSSQKEEITVNGKTIKTTKNTIKMNAKQLKNEITTISNNLKNNEEFLNCFEDKDEITDSLEKILDSAEDIKDNEESYIEINTYTSGFMKKIEKVSVNCYSSNSKQNVTIELTKT